LKTGNQTTLINQLVEQHAKQVHLAAYRILGDPIQAEDVAQNVFVKLLQLTPQKLANIKSWRGYLVRLASTAAIDLIRKQSREKGSALNKQTINIDDSVIDLPSKNHTPSAQLDISRDIVQFRLALAELTQQESQVIVLRLIEDFSYQEISEQLKISESLVGVTLHRAHKKLISLLNESNFLGVNYE